MSGKLEVFHLNLEEVGQVDLKKTIQSGVTFILKTKPQVNPLAYTVSTTISNAYKRFKKNPPTQFTLRPQPLVSSKEEKAEPHQDVNPNDNSEMASDSDSSEFDQEEYMRMKVKMAKLTRKKKKQKSVQLEALKKSIELLENTQKELNKLQQSDSSIFDNFEKLGLALDNHEELYSLKATR